MSSLIEGYNYDVFISYRQKDNKGDKWVSKFVESLKTELEATFKEDISVYFDENPQDRLQDTHNVNKSLENKLKCLILIPIISQTYCDPKSYAWQSEFLPFLRMAEKDSYGKDVKLRSGNVASRILPIRIHDLEQEDINLFEKETGSVLRAIDFVFKTATGAIRPLLPNEDHPNDNLNKTYYRDQISKVAIAIKEIISGLKAASATTPFIEKTNYEEPIEQIIVKEKKGGQIKSLKLTKRKLIFGVAIIAILIVAAVYVNPKIINRGELEDVVDADGRIPIAVMPFQNQTNDTTLQTMLQSSIITSLANNREEFKVRQIESVTGILQSKEYVNYAAITPSIASKISKKLVANVFIIGSITQSGNTLRLNAQLVNSKTIETFKPFQLDGPKEDIMRLSDSLSAMISNFLIITVLKKEVASTVLQNFVITTSSEAYRHSTLGDKAFYMRDYESAINHYRDALDIDSTFIWAETMISYAYYNQGLYDQAKVWCLRVYEKREQVTNLMKSWINALHAWLFETPHETIRYYRELQAFDNQDPVYPEQIGFLYNALELYDQAIPELESSLGIYNSWHVKPRWAATYINLGYAYHKTGQYKKEKKLYKKAERDFPDDQFVVRRVRRQAILALSTGKTKAANEYIEKFIAICKENSTSEAEIASNLAFFYEEAEDLDKAEEYYRQALFLEPENPTLIDALAYFLIDQDRNVVEGLELVQRALESQPENYNFLHTQGWGLYKQGKYQEALQVLQKSWDIRREEAVYDHEAYLHLEEARKEPAN